MTTDIRAALRAAAAIFDMLANRSEASDYHPLVIPTEYHDAARNFRALADAPPTVAELLTDERFIAGTHAIAFTCHDGAELWVRAGAWKEFTVEVNPHGAHSEASEAHLYSYDFSQPATLVEVSP